jgi:hypothetical protein
VAQSALCACVFLNQYVAKEWEMKKMTHCGLPGMVGAKPLLACAAGLALLYGSAHGAVVIRSGGALGTQFSAPGPFDLDGDGLADVNFNTFAPPGAGSGFVDRNGVFGLVGDIGGSPGTGAAWVRNTSFAAAVDGVGRNEIVADFRGALLFSDNNWSKVHFTTGDGWVQWRMLSSNEITALLFVREAAGENLTANAAFLLAAAPVPEPASIWLMGLGLAVAAGSALRRANRAS